MSTLEQLFTSPAGFGVTTASPAQRAICRILDGRPLGDLLEHPDVIALVGGEQAIATLPTTPPKEALLLAAIRSGKSLLAAACAVHASQHVDLSKLSRGEVPRVSVISLSLDLGRVVFEHLTGALRTSPVLRQLQLSEPTADSVMLRHPSGRPVEIKVSAGARAGASLVSRWSAGCIFDEAPRMIGSEDGVVNLVDSRRAVVGRLLPGALLLEIGSPWAPFGPVYEMTNEHFGHPSSSLVVMRAPGPAMNPQWWTPTRCAELAAKDPVAYRTDVLGEFADPEASLFSAELLDRATRTGPLELPPETCSQWHAAIDPATRSNAFTLVLVGRDGDRLRVGLARQWKPQKGVALSPGAVLAEIAQLTRPYGIRRVRSDGWSADALADLAAPRGLIIDDATITASSRVDLYEGARTLLSQGLVELAPVAELRSDLLSVRKRVTQTGLTIDLPRSGDGRHADFAPSFVLALDDAFRHGDAYKGTSSAIGHASDMRRQVGEAQRTLGLRFTPSPDGTTINAGGVFARSQRAGGTFTKGSGRGGGF